MFTKLRTIDFLLVVPFLAFASSWAAGAGGLEGTVKDITGKPLKGAEVRVEAKSGNVISKTLTDANGHYLAGSVPAGIYKVDLVVNSVVKASLSNVKAGAGKSTQLNFDLKTQPAQTTVAKKATHRIWIPPQTGTHIGGRWVDVDDEGTATKQNVQRADGRLLQRMQAFDSNRA